MANISRTCNLCGVMMHGGVDGFTKHGEEHHPNHFLQTGGGRAVFAEKTYWCPLDQKWYASRKYLARAIIKHGWTNERYYLAHGNQYMKKEWEQNTSDPVLGDARNHNRCIQCGIKTTSFDAGHWAYAAFCGFKCSTKWYAENTDRPAQAMATLKERQKENPDLNLRPSQKKYWLNRGYTEDEAKAKVKERQSTNSLEAFIKRAGGDEEIGTKNHADRQEKWLASMSASGMYSGFSKVSESLFCALEKSVGIKLLYGKEERSVRFTDQVYKLDCLCEDTKKVIEFFGDYWHGNPSIYSSDFMIRAKRKYSVGEKWETDRLRIEDLEKKGYKVLIIWETEFKENPQKTIEKCVEFLNS